MPLIRILLLTIFSVPILAQEKVAAENPYEFACEGGFYQLINNQLHIFSVNSMGYFFFAPILPPFARPLSALSYHTEDGFMYSFDTLSFDLVRIYQSGALQPLGPPTHEVTKERLKTKLTIGEIANGFFCAYSPSEDQLYWVDLEKNTFVTTAPLIGGQLVNLAYHPQEKMLYTLSSNSLIYAINPITKTVTTRRRIRDLSTEKIKAKGSLWITKDGRLFVTRNQGSSFYEANESTELHYQSRDKILESSGDATSCPHAYASAIIDDELFEWKADLPNRGSVMVRWIGVHEYNNESYFVEHSIDNTVWTARDQKPSPGLKAYLNPYGSRSNYTQGKANYYRLRKTYKYGSQEIYSRTIVTDLDTRKPNFILSPKASLGNHALALYISGYEGALLDIEITDVHGKILKHKEQPILGLEITLSWDIEDFPAGLYFITIKTPQGVKKDWFWLQ